MRSVFSPKTRRGKDRAAVWIYRVRLARTLRSCAVCSGSASYRSLSPPDRPGRREYLLIRIKKIIWQYADNDRRVHPALM